MASTAWTEQLISLACAKDGLMVEHIGVDICFVLLYAKI